MQYVGGKRMRREKISMLILTVTCMLAGCGGEKTPEVSSLSIDKEGKVSHHLQAH